MVRLQVVKLMRREARLSDELRHLHDMCVAHAEQVFDEVRPIEITPDEPSADVGFDPGLTTLIIGAADVLVARRSLETMRAALSDGCEVVVAAPLHDFPTAAQPVYSLCGFEEIEGSILETSASPRQPAASHLPVALAAPAWLRRTASDGGVGRLLTDGTLLADPETDTDAVQAGVFFELADYYGQRREDILPLLPESATRVLEVGCGRGITASMVAKRLDCPVVGVELNAEIATEAAGRLDDVIVGDALSVEIDGTFEVVIATEVLEHVEDTDGFLCRMRNLLEPGGRLILSVPNVGHYSVVADLVRGRWDYVPAGLLCVTHRRFFTRRSLSEALRRAAFSAYEIHPQATELPDRLLGVTELPGAEVQSLRTHSFLVSCTR